MAKSAPKKSSTKKKPAAKKSPAKPAPASSKKKKTTAAKPVKPARPAAAKKPAPATKPVKVARPAPLASASPDPIDIRKIKSPLSAKELREHRDLLLAKRAEILGDMDSMSQEALRNHDSANLSHMPLHMADVGSDNHDQELMLGLVESERQIVREINDALERIADKTYGVCQGTGKPIGKARLAAKPWAKYCIEYARQMEGNGRRR